MTTIAIAIVGKAITIWEAIQKRSHEPIYKTYTKIEAKRLRAISSSGIPRFSSKYSLGVSCCSGAS